MEKYSRVEKPKPESPINENEIRVTTQGLIRNYISYATTLLQEKRAKEIVLKAMGQAISKTVAISEIIKKRIPGLHQDIAISSVTITDVWEPNEEGLVQLETTRQVSMISITLSTKELSTSSPGYQAPSQFDQQQPKQEMYYQQSQPRQGRGMYNAVYEDSYGRGRGRGRGRGQGQSWGRGGYGTYQDNGGYSNWGRGGGRGRGGGYYDNGGYSNWGRGGGRGRGRGYYDGGYQGGRGEGRGYEGRGYEGRSEGRGYEGRSEGRGYEGRGYEGRGEGRGYEGRGEGRGYGRGPRGRGRMGGRSRGGAYQA